MSSEPETDGDSFFTSRLIPGPDPPNTAAPPSLTHFQAIGESQQVIIGKTGRGEGRKQLGVTPLFSNSHNICIWLKGNLIS